MDLAEVLDATEPVECEFLDHKITAHIYTAGWNRITKEERDRWIEVESDEEPNPIVQARTILPIILKNWDFDGTPMEYRGEPFPPTIENMARCPDALLVAVGNPVLARWSKANPTNGGQPPTGSPQEGKPESLPAENTSP